MGRLLLVIVLVGVVLFVLVKVVGGRARTAGGAVSDPDAGEAQAYVGELHGLVRRFVASTDSELGDRREELARLVDAAESAAHRHGLRLERSEVKDLVAKSFAAQGVGPDYQVRTLLDFV